MSGIVLPNCADVVLRIYSLAPKTNRLNSDLCRLLLVVKPVHLFGGTTAAAPPPFRPSNPALCGSCPLVTPYYCRLGDLLCFIFVSFYCLLLCMYICILLFAFSVFSFVASFSTLILLVGSFDL